MRDKTGSQT